MNLEAAKKFVSKVEACNGYPVGNNGVRAVWADYLSGIGQELADRAWSLLEARAGDFGFTSRNRPNLTTFKGAVAQIMSRDKNDEQAYTSTQAQLVDCQWCKKSGFVYVLRGGDAWNHLFIRRRSDRVNWPCLTCTLVPCMCPAGYPLLESEHFNLSSLAVDWIFKHAAMPYAEDIYEIIRQCRGIKLTNNQSAMTKHAGIQP